MDKNNAKLEDLEAVSIGELLKYFNGASAIRGKPKALNDARLALGTLSAIGRLKATIRVKDATQLDVIKNVADNKEEFKKFAAASLPHLIPKGVIKSLS